MSGDGAVVAATAAAERLATVATRREAGGAVLRLTLDRPPLNILDMATLGRLADSLAAARDDPSLRTVVLDAAPGARAFSAGVDVADHTADRVGAMLSVFHRAVLELLGLPVPTLAVVGGAALGGGCELVLACDLVVASEDARFGQPEITLAAFAPVATALLPGQIGGRRAADWLLTGRTVDAREAFEAGLVNRLVPADALPSAAEAMIGSLATLSGAALRQAKQALRGGDTAAIAERLRGLERQYVDELMATADAHEGLAAFQAKRAPEWSHR